MFNFGFKSEDKEDKVSAGLDIGTYSIKALQLRRSADQLHLETYGELEMAAYDSLPPGSITNIGEEKLVVKCANPTLVFDKTIDPKSSMS